MAQSVQPGRMRLNPARILYMREALNDRGLAILAQFPDAEREVIEMHNRLPEHLLETPHFQAKRDLLILGTLKTLRVMDNGRSSDFIAPSLANGCLGGCTYCYVDRRKTLNPITLFTNTEAALAAVDRHAMKQPWPKPEGLQTDPTYWVYEIGMNSDASVDAGLTDSMRLTVDFYRQHPRAKASFATKFVNRDLLNYSPGGKTRIRFSLMPPAVSRLVDVRTDAIPERIAALVDFQRAGYEVHLSFAPVIVYGEDETPPRWLADYRELFRQIDAAVDDTFRAQGACEVIFLTHNAKQHEANLAIHPQAEALLWRPELQEKKYSQFGGVNLRYKASTKAGYIRQWQAVLQEELPWCRVRYIF